MPAHEVAVGGTAQHLDEWIVVAVDVEDDDRVEVEAKLLPGDDFEQFLERATTAGQGHATVAEVGHGLLAGVHVGRLDELGEARVVPALLDHEGGNDARHLASCGQAGIG